jgi:hypothetical protein
MGTTVREFFTSRWLIIITGLVIGTVAALLNYLGNPGNTTLAPTCFLRDISGALILHTHEGFQYIRPEVIGIVFGSMGAAFVFREFKPRGGSSPLTRFFLAILLEVGALTFLGCPTRVIIRLAGGDLGAVAGILGLALGIYIGVVFLKRGFDMSHSRLDNAGLHAFSARRRGPQTRHHRLQYHRFRRLPSHMVHLPDRRLDYRGIHATLAIMLYGRLARLIYY